MSSAYIVCEGSLDAKILISVLPKELLNDVAIVEAEGKSAAKSLARSLLVRRQQPVLLVLDSDTTATSFVQEQLQSTKEIVEGVAGRVPVKVILAIPELEIIFFHDINLLSHMLGYKPSQDGLDWAVIQPRKTLDQMITHSENIKDKSHFIDQLANVELEELRKAEVVQEIVAFLEPILNSTVREPQLNQA
jgi:hypothetical protein